MAVKLRDRLQHAWNVFKNPDSNGEKGWWQLGAVSGSPPGRAKLRLGNERSIVASIYNQIAMDCASLAIQHVRLDQDGRYEDTINSSLNEVLTLSANTDQTGPELIHDAVISMFDEGVVALVPVDTSINPNVSNSYEIESMRTGKIIEWYPKHVRVQVYNENLGLQQMITVPKSRTAIIENPFYAVMNEPNSTLKRLIRKLNLLDAIDEQSGAGKLDIIIQLPYVIKTPERQRQAEKRRKDVEMQLAGSKYGIAYIDGTERVTQLNRPAENNLMSQIEYLTSMLYSQLGMSKEIFDGTANEATMLNYNNRTIDPVLSAICLEMKRKFLTKTARSQRQSIMYFAEPFKLVPTNELADIADKFTRNEILTSNEVRAIIGFKPVKDPKADELRNKNLNETTSNETVEVAEQIEN